MIRIVESKFITSAVKSSGYPPTVAPEFAFVGRSNVGKSSMINSLTNRKLLAKIANKPGKTRLINFFECRFLEVESGRLEVENGKWKVENGELDEESVKLENSQPCHSEQSMASQEGDGINSQFSILNFQFTLVDLPGYGFAQVSKAERNEWQRMISEYFHSRKQLTGVVLLVDIRHESDPKDVIMVKMLRDLGVKFIIAATKCDKIASGKVAATLKGLRAGFELKEEFIY